MKIVELIKNMGILAIGGICTKAINFLLLPLYTSLISAEEYGTIDVLTTIVTLLVYMVSFQMYDAIFKYATMQRGNVREIKIVFTNIWAFSICICLLFSVIYIIIFEFLDFVGKWYILSAVVSTIFLYTATCSSRSLGHNKLYSFANFISALVMIVLNLLFLVILKLSALTILYSYVIGPLVGGLICVLTDRLWQYWDLRLLNVEKIKEYLRYSLPLIPNEVAWWVIQASDRLVVATFLGLYSAGLLTVATKFSVAYSTIFGFFYTAWVEQCFLHYNTDFGREHIQKLIPKIFIGFCYVTLVLILVCMYVYPIVIDSAYSEAYTLVPWYFIAVLFNVCVGLLHPIYLVLNETKVVMYTTVIAGVINFLANVLLIQHIGILSAPIAAIIGYGVVGIWRWLDINRRYLRIEISYKNILEMVCMLGLVVWVYYYHANDYWGIGSFVIVGLSMIAKFGKEIKNMIKV